MWDEVQQFVESLLANYGIARVLLGPFAVITLLASLGLVKGGTTAFIGVGLSLFVAVVVITALTMQLRSTRELLSERERVVNLYTEQFLLSDSELYSIEDWDESVIITKNGDTKLEKWVTIRVGDDSLYSTWSWIQEARMSKEGSISESARRQVKFEARSFNEQRVLGARYDVTKKWDGNKVQLFIHFDQPARAGQIVRVWMRWEWPRYYKSLLEGDTSIVDWLMQRPTKRIATTMTFDRSCHIRDDFHITPYGDCDMPLQSRAADDALIVRWERFDIPLGIRVGFRLDGREIHR